MKKSYHRKVMWREFFTKKTIRIMKMYVIIAFMTLGELMATDVLTQNISLDIQNQPLSQAISEIEEMTEYHVFYNSKLVDLSQKITIQIRNASLEEALDHLFANKEIDYLLVKNLIVLFRKGDPDAEKWIKTIVQENPVPDKSVSANRVVPLLTRDKITLRPTRPILSGIVTDESGEPLIGVNVLVKGTNQGTSTDFEGRFSLDEVDDQAVLVVSYIGYQTQEIKVGGKTEIEIVLIEDSQTLDEVVVVGYGTQRKSDLTGSVSSVKGESLKGQVIRNPVQALSGLAAGVQVMQNSGAPGASLSVRVRGANSLIGGNEPLYVIDGLPMTISLDNINPNDIQSIEVLKDASATAIYGSRGANGVVLITTKKGKEGGTVVEYDGYYGIQNVSKKINMLNAREFATIANIRAQNDGDDLFFTEDELTSLGKGINWQDQIFRSAPIHNHSLSISGGNTNTQIKLTANYFDQEGIIIDSYFEKVQLVTNLNHKLNDTWSVSLNSIFGRTGSNFLHSDNTERGAGVLSGALIAPPTIPVYDENGDYSFVRPYFFSPDILENPVAMAEQRINKNKRNSILTNAVLEGNIWRDLILRSSVGVQYTGTRSDFYSPTIFQPSATGSASIGYSERLNIINENTLTYTRSIGQHSGSLLTGVTAEKNTSESVTARATGFLTDILENQSLGTGTTPGIPSSGYTEYSILSALGRLNYNFAGKYLFTASFRADGSSRFGKSNRWGYFPSMALGWRVSEETFWDPLKDWINSFKIRGGWGVTGNTAISPYQSLSILSSTQAVFDDNLQIGFAPGSTRPNPNLKWEKTRQAGLGFDMGLMEDRILISFDYYNKITDDLLSSVPVPSSSGYFRTVTNLGSIGNTGYEVSVHGQILDGPVSWAAGFNLSHNQNEVISLAGDADIFGATLGNTLPAMNLVRVGQPVGVFYGYIEDGLTEEGVINYTDLNGDGEINNLDRTIIGNPNPKLVIGLNSFISYKKFDFSFIINSIQGVDILNYNLSNIADGFSFGINQVRDLLGNYWTPEEPDTYAKYPRISKNTRYLGSDRFVEDGSYIRLSNVQLGYTLFLGHQKKIESQIYLAAQNLFTWTDYTFYTPEVNTRGAGISRGIDQFGYPDARTFTLGLKIKL